MQELSVQYVSEVTHDPLAKHRRAKGRHILRDLWRYRFLYLLALPGLLFMVVFRYIPMPGIIIAFQDFSVAKGFLRSPWLGLENFTRLFSSPDFWVILRNTLTISALGLVFLFPAPIVLALLLNELKSQPFKRGLQTVYYLPHFLSWVIVVSLTYFFLSTEVGVINKAILALGGTKIPFLLDSQYFYPMLIVQGLWKGVGWGTIIYLAAMAGLDPALYEAAQIDGAGKWAQIRHVTIPGIMPTVRILFILNMGGLLSTNFEQVWLMQNAMILDVAEVIDTYVYRTGVTMGQFSYTTAVGLFKSVIGLILILSANWFAKRNGEEGVW